MADDQPRHPGGRPTLLTDEIQQLICQAISEGNYREVAAKWVGISKRTLVDWCTRGRREPDGPYGKFLRAIIEAEQGAEMKMVEQVFRAATRDPKHAQWWLTHKCPERWSSRRVEMALLKRQLAELQKQVGDGTSRPPQARNEPVESTPDGADKPAIVPVPGA